MNPIKLRGSQDNLVNVSGQGNGQVSASDPRMHRPAPVPNLSSAPHLIVNINTTNNFGSSNFGKAPEGTPGPMNHLVADILNANLPLHLSRGSASVGRSNNLGQYQLNEDSEVREEYGHGLRAAAREVDGPIMPSKGDQ